MSQTLASPSPSMTSLKLHSSFCSIAYKNQKDCPLSQIVENVAGQGYSGIELWGPQVEKLSPSELKDLKQFIASQKLKIPMISPYLGNFNLPMTNREEMIQRTRDYAPVAVALGCPLLRTFAGWTCETSSLTASPEYWKYNLDGFSEMAAIMADHDIHLALETHGKTLADSLDGIMRIVEAGKGRILINLQLDDVAQNSGLKSGVEVYRKLKDLIVHFHIHPTLTDPAEIQDHREVMQVMIQDGFQGFVSIEPCRGTDDPLVIGKSGMEFLQRLCA